METSDSSSDSVNSLMQRILADSEAMQVNGFFKALIIALTLNILCLFIGCSSNSTRL